MIETLEGERLTTEELLHEASAQLRLASDLHVKLRRGLSVAPSNRATPAEIAELLDMCKHIGDAVQRLIMSRILEQDPPQIRIALKEGASLKRQRESDVGHDLRAMLGTPRTIPAWGRWVCRTGVYLELPPDVEAQIRPRSGLTHHHGVMAEVDTVSPGATTERGIVPGIATIDPGYRGELEVVLFNNSDQDYTIQPGERIAQIVFNRVVLPQLVVVDVEDLSSSDRGELGKGSSGRL